MDTTLPAGYEDLPQAEREAALLKWAAEVEAATDARQGDDWTKLDEGILHLRACTSLSDEDATARANMVPSGTSAGWVLCTEEGRSPVACKERPDTHRHLLWEC